jgi:hypothetical protein
MGNMLKFFNSIRLSFSRLLSFFSHGFVLPAKDICLTINQVYCSGKSSQVEDLLNSIEVNSGLSSETQTGNRHFIP